MCNSTKFIIAIWNPNIRIVELETVFTNGIVMLFREYPNDKTPRDPVRAPRNPKKKFFPNSDKIRFELPFILYR